MITALARTSILSAYISLAQILPVAPIPPATVNAPVEDEIAWYPPKIFTFKPTAKPPSISTPAEVNVVADSTLVNVDTPLTLNPPLTSSVALGAVVLIPT